jgi:phosphopantothenoylcysteine decarboxylase/phosphopantothenate--cysteine ligase
VLAETQQADVLIMAAAVADFRPADVAGNKIKKGSGIPTIRLVETSDILARLAEVRASRGYPRVTVGFAAESQNLLANAQAKLQTKRLDLIVANDISARDAGFGVDTNRVVLLAPGQEPEALPLLSKEQVAEAVLERVLRLL